MSYGLNVEMHKQTEICKRLDAIIRQVLPFLSGEVSKYNNKNIKKKKKHFLGKKYIFPPFFNCEFVSFEFLFFFLIPSSVIKSDMVFFAEIKPVFLKKEKQQYFSEFF